MKFVAEPFGHLLPNGAIFSFSLVGLFAEVGICISATVIFCALRIIFDWFAKGGNGLGIYSCLHSQARQIWLELIHQAVAGQHEKVRQISFLEALQCIIDAIPQMNIAAAAQADIQLEYLRSLIAECVIDRPQRNRINPRAVKVKMSKFKRKRKIHKSSYRDLQSELQILRPEAA